MGGDWKKRAGLYAAALAAIGLVAVGLHLNRQARSIDSKIEQIEQRTDQSAASVAEIERSTQLLRSEIAAAESLQRRARESAREDSQRLTEAEDEISTAQQERTSAELQAEAARDQARQARREAAEERRKRTQEWARLEVALGKIAPTSRSGWRLTVHLGKKIGRGARLNRDSKEILSRTAGIFLASQGYRVEIRGGGAALAKSVCGYLVQAGLPDELIGAGASAGELILRVDEKILNSHDGI